MSRELKLFSVASGTELPDIQPHLATETGNPAIGNPTAVGEVMNLLDEMQETIQAEVARFHKKTGLRVRCSIYPSLDGQNDPRTLHKVDISIGIDHAKVTK